MTAVFSGISNDPDHLGDVVVIESFSKECVGDSNGTVQIHDRADGRMDVDHGEKIRMRIDIGDHPGVAPEAGRIRKWLDPDRRVPSTEVERAILMMEDVVWGDLEKRRHDASGPLLQGRTRYVVALAVGLCRHLIPPRSGGEKVLNRNDCVVSGSTRCGESSDGHRNPPRSLRSSA